MVYRESEKDMNCKYFNLYLDRGDGRVYENIYQKWKNSTVL